MATELKLRRGTTSQHSTFTGAESEVTVDTDKNTVVVHDGSTQGGYPLALDSTKLTDETFTVGVSSDFPNIAEAIQHVTENISPVYFAASGVNKFPRITLELQSGFVWNETVNVSGVNLGWITIKTAPGVTINCGGILNIRADAGGVSPKIQGDYTKNGSGNTFIRVDDNGEAIFDGTLSGFINVPIRVASGGKVEASFCTFTKNPGASSAPTALQVLFGGTLIVRGSSWDSLLEVFGGGIAYANSSSGSLSFSANTLNSNGIIFK